MGTLQSSQYKSPQEKTFLSKDNPDTVEAFEMAGLDVAGSQICQEVLALPQFPNLLFIWQISF